MEEPNPAGGTWFTNYVYDMADKLRSVSMPRGGSPQPQTRTFTYNDQAQLASVANPESGTTNYSYYGNGMLWYKTDNKGQKILYEYGSSNRLTAIRRYVDVNTEAPEQRTNIYYDQNPWQSNYTDNAWGRVAGIEYQVSEMTFRESFGYTDGGAVTKKRLRIDKPGMVGTRLALRPKWRILWTVAW